MSSNDKLRKAVEFTINAGYQLDHEAFSFLSILAATEDPTEIISKALKQISECKEKPLFIGRSFLEQIVQKEIPTEESIVLPKAPLEETVSTHSQPLTEAKKLFKPYAKEVEAKISVIENPGEKNGSNGTLEDYLECFRDRFRRMEKILRQRIDVKSAASTIDALKASPNTNLKIIGMITEKRNLQKRTILIVEDLQASITALVPQNATEELHKKAQTLLLDQVVCLCVRKTRGTLFIVEDIILPEIGQKPQHKAPIPVYAALTSDLHIGSTKFHREAFNRFILWLNGKYGNEQMREIASHVKYVLVAGDIVDGIGIYPNQIRELGIKDIYKQYRLAAKFI
ncbi:MAG: hypothetical protein QW840_04530, partial [Candidatus Bathyarchaeia archaeon]